MTKSEAEDIAWHLCAIREASQAVGVDSSTVVANAAYDAVRRIIANHQKIKCAYDNLQEGGGDE